MGTSISALLLCCGADILFIVCEAKEGGTVRSIMSSFQDDDPGLLPRPPSYGSFLSSTVVIFCKKW